VRGKNLGESPVALSFPGKDVRVTLVSKAQGIRYETTVSASSSQLSVTIPKGTLHVRISPYSEMTLDGKAMGEGPYKVLPVYAGYHEVWVTNSDLKLKKRYKVKVDPGEDKVFKLQLGNTASPVFEP
jgi:hypothetical protein